MVTKHIQTIKEYRHLIWTLAKTDFKLRYHGSLLGYIWALLKPLLLFSIIYVVFSSIFNVRASGNEYYGLQLLVALMLFTFFSEGTTAGMRTFLTKQTLVTKIYVPRWTLILASSFNHLLIYLTNCIIILAFFAFNRFVPTLGSVAFFILMSMATYVMILGFSLAAAPLFIRFRDLSMIWEVVIRALMYGSPIIYSLSMLPERYHQLVLLNPLAYVIHFSKRALIDNHFPTLMQTSIFFLTLSAAFALSLLVYKKLVPRVAENM